MTESRLSGVPWKIGGAYGALTYFTALIFTIMWTYYDHHDTILNVEVGKPWELIGLAVASFYEAQFVLTETADYTPYLVRFGPDSRAYLTPSVFYAIPVVLLLIIAAVFVYTEFEGTDRLNALSAGASLAIGYVVASLVVILAVRFGIGAEIPIVRAVAFGVLYPVVLGGLAGVIVNEVKILREG